MTAGTAPAFRVFRAIAWYLNEDEATIEKDRRYQPTRTPCPVYTVGNEYLTATSGGRKPREADDNLFGFWKWEPVTDTRIPAQFGWSIWRAKQEDE